MKYPRQPEGPLLAAGLLLTLLLYPLGVLADEITTRNGDRLSGTVIEAVDGKLVLQTPYAASLALRMDQIATIETEAPVTLRMQGREVLQGRLTTRDGRILLLASEERGETAVSWEQVRSMNVPDVAWTGNVFAGGMHQTGNTDRLSVSFGADVIRRGLDDRFSLSFLYNYAEEVDNLTTRDIFGAMKYDYFFTPTFYGLLSVELLKDRFKDLHLRAVIGPGLGYQVWDDGRKSLALEAGIAYFSEDRVVADDEQWITARIGTVFAWQLTSWIQFSDTFTIYPALEGAGDYTLRNDAALVTLLSSSWSLRLGNIWERNNDPAPDVDKNDFRSSLALQYSF